MTLGTIQRCLASNAETETKDLLVAINRPLDHGRKSFYRVVNFTMLTNGQIVLLLNDIPDYVE